MFSFQGTSPARVPEPKGKAKGVAALRKEEVRKCTSTCEASAWNGKRNCRKLSTKAGTEAWKQAEGNADQWKPKGRSSTGKNRCEGKPGRREKKKQRLSSQNLNGNRTKERGTQGKHLREVERRKKVSTCGTAVGAKQGRAKGNKQKAEYEEPKEMHGKPGKTIGRKPKNRKGKRSNPDNQL